MEICRLSIVSSVVDWFGSGVGVSSSGCFGWEGWRFWLSWPQLLVDQDVMVRGIVVEGMESGQVEWGDARRGFLRSEQTLVGGPSPSNFLVDGVFAFQLLRSEDHFE